MLKKRWPILKNLKNHLPTALDIILACCILHNVALEWGEDQEDDDDSEEDSDEESESEEEVDIQDDELNNDNIRERGARLRENLRENMPPPTASESRRLNRRLIQRQNP